MVSQVCMALKMGFEGVTNIAPEEVTLKPGFRGSFRIRH